MKEWTREEIEAEFIGKMKAFTIPVNVRIEGKQRVLDMTEMESVLRKARVISQDECGCRKMMGNCIEPMDGCLNIDECAEDAIKNYGSRQVTVEQALEALKRTSRAGFVHVAYVFPDQEIPFKVCSCCKCCCHTVGAARKYGYKDQIFPSRVIAIQDTDRCTGCGACVSRCQFDARTRNNGTLEYKAEKCFGCGVCVETCPSEAITMKRRE